MPASLSPSEGQITLAVLAGGASSRMGFDKANLSLGGVPILSRLAKQLRWPGRKLLIRAPGASRAAGAELFDYEATDALSGLGPLQGIVTALDSSPDAIIVLTVDMPGVTDEMIKYLISQAESDRESRGLMFDVCTADSCRIEPFPSFYRQSARPQIAAQITKRRLSVSKLLLDPSFRAIRAPDEWPATVWENLNTQADVAAFEKKTLSKDKMHQ